MIKDLNKLIQEKYEAGLSQNAISKDLNIPRSRVKRTLDEIYGVSADSFADVSLDQIKAIQADVAAGMTQAEAASKNKLGRDTVRRILLVDIKSEKNNVTVISPKMNMVKGEYEQEYAAEPGGFAEVNSQMVYLASSEIYSDAFVCLWPAEKTAEDGNLVSIGVYRNNQLKPKDTEEYSSSQLLGGTHGVAPLAELGQFLETGLSDRYDFFTNYNGRDFQITKGVDSRRRIGLQRTSADKLERVSLSNITEILIKEKPEVNIGGSSVNQDNIKISSQKDFISKHQILILPRSVVIGKDGVPQTIMDTHPAYKSIIAAIENQDIDAAYKLMQPVETLKQYSQGNLRVELNGSDKKVFWKSYDITGSSIAKRLISLCLKGDHKNIERLSKFTEKMYANPSAALVQSGRIFEFMAYADIEIDDDGDIIMYKSVRGNYMDKHSNTISNQPGTTVIMERSFVNDNNSSLCSYGLHVCSLAYLQQCFGSLGQRVVRCKVDPRDIVSITNDFKSSKIRCCKYYVMDDYTKEYNRQYKSIDTEGLYK